MFQASWSSPSGSRGTRKGMGRGGRRLEGVCRSVTSTALPGDWYEATKMTMRAASPVRYMMVTSWRRRFLLKILMAQSARPIAILSFSLLQPRQLELNQSSVQSVERKVCCACSLLVRALSLQPPTHSGSLLPCQLCSAFWPQQTLSTVVRRACLFSPSHFFLSSQALVSWKARLTSQSSGFSVS